MPVARDDPVIRIVANSRIRREILPQPQVKLVKIL
jgi:hypothetical protein